MIVSKRIHFADFSSNQFDSSIVTEYVGFDHAVAYSSIVSRNEVLTGRSAAGDLCDFELEAIFTI